MKPQKTDAPNRKKPQFTIDFTSFLTYDLRFTKITRAIRRFFVRKFEHNKYTSSAHLL